MLNRSIFPYVIKRLTQVPAVALLGPRQIGKTTLAKQLARDIDALYLDLESPDAQFQLSDPVSYFERHRGKLVVLDEVQRVPELFSVLRGVIDRNREAGHRTAQFLLLCSASGELLNQSSESLAGRISFIEMSGLRVDEVSTEPSLNQQLLWHRGGFPEAVLATDDDVAMDWLEDLIRTYLERDIPQAGFNIPATRLRKLWTMIAHSQGENINASKLAMNLEVTNKTVSHYIDILEDMMLVRRLPPFHVNVKKRLVKSPRVYVRDSGIVHRLLKLDSFEALNAHPALGKSWEGYVVEAILSALPKRSNPFYFRTAAGSEIDLVLDLPNNQRWAVEIKYGLSPKLGRHFQTACEDIEATRKFVVYSGQGSVPIGHETELVGLLEFLELINHDF